MKRRPGKLAWSKSVASSSTTDPPGLLQADGGMSQASSLLAALSDIERLVCVARQLGFSFEQIAKQLDASVARVRLIHRDGLDKLRQH